MKFLTWIISSVAFLLLLSACGAKPTPTEGAKVDATLPLVSLTQSGTFVDANAIAFEWNSLKDARVEGIYVYREEIGVESKKSAYYETIHNRFTTHYLDSNIKPNTEYLYYFKTFSSDAESKKSKLIKLKSSPVLESVSWIHSLQEMPRSVKILWRPHTNQKVKGYTLERRTLKDKEFEQIATINGRLSAEYIDNDLDDNRVYKYRLRALTYDGMTSSPSKIVKAVTKALPKTITNIKATRDLPGKIKLTWNDSLEKDFALYYVYRAQNIDGHYELIAKLHNNVHVDKINENQKKYFYRVSAVDKDGLESENKVNTVQGSSLRKPLPPALIEASLVDNKIQLVWSKVDSRAVSYIVTKKYRVGWFKEISEEFKNITKKKFVDYQVKSGTNYLYSVRSVDKYKIQSEPSMEVEFRTPESGLELLPLKSEPQKAVQTKIIDGVGERSPELISPMQALDLNEI